MEESLSKDQKEIIEKCDAIVWEVLEEKVRMSFFKNKNKVEPSEIGFMYDIILYKVAPEHYSDSFSAIIGDPFAYVNRISDIGYSGIMIKKGAMSFAKTKKTFKNILEKIDLTANEINKLCEQLK